MPYDTDKMDRIKGAIKQERGFAKQEALRKVTGSIPKDREKKTAKIEGTSKEFNTLQDSQNEKRKK